MRSSLPSGSPALPVEFCHLLIRVVVSPKDSLVQSLASCREVDVGLVPSDSWKGWSSKRRSRSWNGDLLGLEERNCLGVEECVRGDRGYTRAAPVRLLSSLARRPTARVRSAQGTVTRCEGEGAASGVGLGVGLGAKRDPL